ncbi:MAG: hypothetical protein KTR26_20405 [Flammeovirgaceae bacterium]|nr:hypothetical protein [Flammeovirgaceae bacterium]
MEDWKYKIMNSLEGIEKAQPNEQSFYKIQTRIKASKRQVDYPKYWLAVAATIVLILCGNVVAITTFYKSDAIVSDSPEYIELITDFNIYNP